MAASLDSQDARFDACGSLILSPGNRRTAGTLPDITTQGANDIAQPVRTREGSRADITTGTSQLVPSRTVRRTDNGVLIQDTAVERDISSGFYVTPRVNGDTVMLDISTQRDTPATRLGAGAAHINLTVTSVSGRPGKWIEFSGINQSSGIEGGGTLSRSSSSGSMNQRVYLRVDEAR